MFYDGVAVPGVVRLLPTGAVDTTFSPPLVDHGNVDDIQLLVDGSILIHYMPRITGGPSLYWLTFLLVQVRLPWFLPPVLTSKSCFCMDAAGY